MKELFIKLEMKYGYRYIPVSNLESFIDINGLKVYQKNIKQFDNYGHSYGFEFIEV